jgi:hypothetical protein
MTAIQSYYNRLNRLPNARIIGLRIGDTQRGENKKNAVKLLDENVFSVAISTQQQSTSGLLNQPAKVKNSK